VAVVIDIEAVLADEGPVKSGRRCKVQRWLDDIDETSPGRDKLVAIVNTQKSPNEPQDEWYRPADATLGMLARLGLTTSAKTFGDHRGRRCRCFY
jgi:hypothetical protein